MPSAQDPGPVLTTPRLRLRPWRDDDLAPFADMGADPTVMRHMPGVLDRAASDALAERFRAHFRDHGFGRWAVDLVARAPRPSAAADVPPQAGPAPGFIGFVGLAIPSFDAPFTPCVEISWRLARRAWGLGFATEAARAALAFGFVELGLRQIVSFTTPANTPSIRVMERLGMDRDPAEDFDHPRLPPGDRLRRHVLYRRDRDTWRREQLPGEARPS